MDFDYVAQLNECNMENSKTPKELTVEEKIISLVDRMVRDQTGGDDLPRRVIDYLLGDAEIKAIQDYANNVSISRLGYNDHGPVHMKMVTYNALKMLSILHEAYISTNLENEGAGSFADSVAAVMIAAMMHDFGMSMGRKNHEFYSSIIAFTIIDKLLVKVLPDEADVVRRTVIRSLAMEGIVGHMGTQPIHSLEAGIILVADGCDMTKGRARISLEINSNPTVGDIHKYSANSIERVKIRHGGERPLKIEVQMKSEVGLFQIEQVLMPKIQASPAQKYVELYAGVEGEEVRRYM